MNKPPIAEDTLVADPTKNSSRHQSAKQKPHALNRYKVTYDLTQDLADAVYSVALNMKCSLSDVAMAFLCEGLERYATNQLDLKARRKPHRFSLRFAYKLTPPKVPHIPTPSDEEVMS